MTEREMLVEVMALATVAWRWGDPDAPHNAKWVKHDSEMIREALAAAERAGFEFRMKEDSDG